MESRRVVLRFPKGLVDQPITSRLIRDYDLDFNILRADITSDAEGVLVLGLTGKKGSLDKALHWAREQGVVVEPLSKDIVQDEKRCVHCGACTAVCPSGALAVELETRKVPFNSNRCIACERCVAVCPYRAMTISF
jgi:L-aspartate semialdehyde sulfurtransferase ferredoxin